MRYYNFETRFISLRDAMREYLKANNIYYELSGAAAFYHFEIKTDPAGAAAIEKWLDTQIITEV